MADKKLRVMMIGAHPDDCDGNCGGLALKYSRLGHKVKFVSTTDGSAGHQSYDRATIAQIRKKEAAEAASTAGIEDEVLDFPDGGLEVTLQSRDRILSLIREFKPDILFTHRPNDYHPDHRYTSQLVQDASYLVMVPNVCPDVPILRHQPVIFYMYDDFKRPYEFSADVVIDVDDVLEQKLKLISCHRSQYFDWLPWIARLQGQIPEDYDDSRYARDEMDSGGRRVAERFRELLCSRYGSEKGGAVEHAEAFELCEYGRQIDQKAYEEYFPF